MRPNCGMSVLSTCICLSLLFGQSCLGSALRDCGLKKCSLHDEAVSRIDKHELDRRHIEIEQDSTARAPLGVRKMSSDPSEMFFLEYWQFELHDQKTDVTKSFEPIVRTEDMPVSQTRAIVVRDLASFNSLNASMSMIFLPPFMPHSEEEEPFTNLQDYPRNSLFKRNFQCPTGTNACTSIGEPNSCCATNEVCMKITDTGLGSVGCCPSGQTCAGSVSTCNTAQGYTSCPGTSNGGCCIPDYSCQGIGCE